MVGAGFFSFGFFDFIPYAFALLLRKLYLFGQLIFKSADMVEIYLNAVNGVLTFLHRAHGQGFCR